MPSTLSRFIASSTSIVLSIGIGLAALSFQGCAPVIVAGAAATGGSIYHDRRTTGSFVEDQTINIKIRNKISSDDDFDGGNSDLGIDSFNGLVLLTGTAIADDLRQRAENYAREVEKVRIVYNEIIVGETGGISEDGNDILITTTIKAGLFSVEGQEDIDPLRVSVTTHNGIVYLMGLVTRAEADAITEEVRVVSDVKKVIRLFEYLD